MKTISLTKEFTINAPVQYVFQLICPVMEYKWIPGWKTKLVYCPKGKNEKGVVFKEMMSTPFIMGKAFGKTTWQTLLCDKENYKISFRWDNKISTSIFKVVMIPTDTSQTKCIFSLNMSSINEKGEKVLTSKNEYKTEFLLTGLGEMLKFYCENSTMLNSKKSKRKAEFLNKLTITEKLVFLFNKIYMKLIFDRDKRIYLTQGDISKKTKNKVRLTTLGAEY